MTGSTFAERMEIATVRAGGPSALARSSNVPLRSLAGYRRGQTEPDVSRLVAIAQASDVRVGWLAAGEGEMEPGASRTSDATLPSSGPNSDLDFLRDVVQALEEALEIRGAALAPDKKGEAVVLLYKYFRETGEIDQDQIARIINLAA